MTRIAGEVLIDRPVEDVFDFVADERNEPSYNRDMLRCELLTAGLVVGARRERACSLGVKRYLEAEAPATPASQSRSRLGPGFRMDQQPGRRESDEAAPC